MSKLPSERYDRLGASASKSGLHAALSRAGLAEGSGVFIRLNSDLAGDPEYASFLHCDGAGTKAVVAYLVARETGDLSAYAGLAHDALVMNLDDCLCSGLPERLLVANTIARNRSQIGDEVLAVLFERYRNLVEFLGKQGLTIELAGGETADCGDTVRTLVVDAVLGGRIRRSSIIDCNAIEPGDAIVGVSSTGQAGYEEAPNSGIGSNGLTLARHTLLHHEYVTRYPEVVDPCLSPDVAYTGPFSVTDVPDRLGTSIGEALLSPTRTYAPFLISLLRQARQEIHGIIHVTGGGLTKVLRFGRGNRYVKNNLFPTPPLFALIQQCGAVHWREMYEVFNMGHRLELYLPRTAVAATLKLAEGYGLEAREIGHVEPAATRKAQDGSNEVRIESPHGIFDYDLAP